MTAPHGYAAGVSGGRAASIRLRAGSSHGGSTSVSPRCSRSSSTAKPGPSVASSKSTPPGSWKYTDLNQKRSMTGVGLPPGGLDLHAHGELMRLVVHAPGEMVDAADAPGAAPRIRGVADVDDARGVVEPVARPAVLLGDLLEAQHRGQESGRRRQIALPELRAVEAAHLMLGSHGAVVPGRERPAGRSGRLDERDAQPVRIDERQRALAEARLDRVDARAVLLEARAPELEAVRRHFEPDLDRKPVADPRRRHLRPGKERQIRAGMSFGVRIEEVVGARVVLIDALLDQPHAEHAAVEVEILLRRPGDGGDVVESVDGSHLRDSRSGSVAQGSRLRAH